MTREEHIKWCKDRAFEYLDKGDGDNAFISMISDLGKYEETTNHPAIAENTRLFIDKKIDTIDKMREPINSFI